MSFSLAARRHLIAQSENDDLEQMAELAVSAPRNDALDQDAPAAPRTPVRPPAAEPVAAPAAQAPVAAPAAQAPAAATVVEAPAPTPASVMFRQAPRAETAPTPPAAPAAVPAPEPREVAMSQSAPDPATPPATLRVTPRVILPATARMAPRRAATAPAAPASDVIETMDDVDDLQAAALAALKAPAVAPASEAPAAAAPVATPTSRTLAAAPAVIPGLPVKAPAGGATRPTPIGMTTWEAWREMNLNLTNVDGVAACGDPEIEQTPEVTPERLYDFEIPKRPKKWPAIMEWPPRAYLDHIADLPFSAEMTNLPADQREAAVKEARELLWANLLTWEPIMLERAAKMHDWIEEHGGKRRRHERKSLEKSWADPHFGIRFAILLDPEASKQAATLGVVRWGHARAETLDGGAVIATDNGLRSLKPSTEQSVELMIREGLARGWSSFNFAGDKDFCMKAVKAAREAGVPATITLHRFPFGIDKVIKVMPHIPSPEQLHMGTGIAAQVPGTPENDGQKRREALAAQISAGPVPGESPTPALGETPAPVPVRTAAAAKADINAQLRDLDRTDRDDQDEDDTLRPEMGARPF